MGRKKGYLCKGATSPPLTTCFAANFVAHHTHSPLAGRFCATAAGPLGTFPLDARDSTPPGLLRAQCSQRIGLAIHPRAYIGAHTRHRTTCSASALLEGELALVCTKRRAQRLKAIHREPVASSTLTREQPLKNASVDSTLPR